MASLISRAINSVGAGILIVMMFLTAVDVILRYVFNRPITGSYELSEYLMVIVVAFGLAYCAVLKGHVRVDLVISRFSPRAQATINSITYLVSLGLFSLITRQCILYIRLVLDSELTSAVLLIPAFPFVALLALGSAVFCLVLLADLVNSVSQVMKK